MPYHIAGIDVHKKMLAVVVADVEVEDDYHFERLKVGTSPVQLRARADWLVERDVEEVVMESTDCPWTVPKLMKTGSTDTLPGCHSSAESVFTSTPQIRCARINALHCNG